MVSGVILTWSILATVCANILATPTHDKRIRGGEDATIESAPFQVSIRKWGGHLCGGSILNARHILTAAHCVVDDEASEFSIIYGKTAFCGEDNVIEVESFVVHDSYNRSSFDNDVAVLILKSEIAFSDAAQPIELATEAPAAGTLASVTGWGALTDNGGIPSTLKRVEINIVDRSDCEARFTPDPITEQMLCGSVDGGGKDACQYDSGGPLVVDHTQVGIVSFGIGCGHPDYPGVYANVAKLRDWILENIEEANMMRTQHIEEATPTHEKRIRGGEDATIESAPFQVSVRKWGGHLCGGSILSARHILTAAHCVVDDEASEFSIRYGKTSFCSEDNVIEVESFVLHDSYNRSFFDNDVAILTLKSEIEFSDAAQPIELATEAPATGTLASVTGWGALTEHGGIPSTLRRVEINIVDRSDCEARFTPIPITEQMLCAGVDGGGKDACQYDSGGPLVVDHAQVGVASFGVGCGRQNFPGVYVNVAKVRDWILENIEEANMLRIGSTTPQTEN